jgi:quinol monooxygenase YgiN
MHRTANRFGDFGHDTDEVKHPNPRVHRFTSVRQPARGEQRANVRSVAAEPHSDFEPDVELAIVTMRFDAADPGALLALLAKYVVLTRMEPACRNVDLCGSYTHPGRYLIVQKWASHTAQRAHFDSSIMIEMAQGCIGLLTNPPDIDLWDGASAHDLR